MLSNLTNQLRPEVYKDRDVICWTRTASPSRWRRNNSQDIAPQNPPRDDRAAVRMPALPTER